MGAKLSGKTFKSNESEQLHVNYKLTLIFMSKRERWNRGVATKVLETDHSNEAAKSDQTCSSVNKEKGEVIRRKEEGRGTVVSLVAH